MEALLLRAEEKERGGRCRDPGRRELGFPGGEATNVEGKARPHGKGGCRGWSRGQLPHVVEQDSRGRGRGGIPLLARCARRAACRCAGKKMQGKAGWRFVAPWMGEISPARGEQGRD
jgi:hypothetical protein